MKSEILNKSSMSGIRVALAWTFRQFPDPETKDIPGYLKTPDYIYILSGSRSDTLDFLRYSGVHDIRESWNPADYYGQGVIDRLGMDSEAYQDLEPVLLPETYKVSGSLANPYKFFGTVDLAGNTVSLFRFPENTWKVEFYEEDGFTKNHHDGLVLTEYVKDQTKVTHNPVMRVTFGPDPGLLNNPDSMYEVVPGGRTDSVLSLEYKRLIDELRSSKVLGIEFSPHGLGKVESLNVSASSWGLVDLPERHKENYYVGYTEFSDQTDISTHSNLADGIIIDKLSGSLLGTSRVDYTPLRYIVKRQKEGLKGVKPFSYNIPYRTGDRVEFHGGIYESTRSENIGDDPILGGSWKYALRDGSSPFMSPARKFNTVSISTTGSGDVYFPDSPETSAKGLIGTTAGYVRLGIRPDPGYMLEGLQTYSYRSGAKVSNLISESSGNYVLYIGGTYGYSFGISFVKKSITIVSDLCVPGINYYTYRQDIDNYTDRGVTYNSLTGTSVNTVTVLPMGNGMTVDYSVTDGTSLVKSVSYVLEGIGINIPTSDFTIDSGKTVRIDYKGLLKYYHAIKDPVCKYYRGSSVFTQDTLESGVSGDTYSVFVPATEATCHVVLSLAPNDVIIEYITTDDYDLSVLSSSVNYGDTTTIEVYYSGIGDNREPVVTTDEEVMADSIVIEPSTEEAKVWVITLNHLRSSGEIYIS